MSEPFIGEVTMFAGGIAPPGWAQCNGQLLQIAQNETLFSLIGTTYGGDGTTTFALPDLRGRTAINSGHGVGLNNYAIGEQGGAETVTLTESQIPSHTHALQASANAGSWAKPAGKVLAKSRRWNIYRPNVPGDNMNLSAIASTGDGQPHNNMMPFQCVNFIIALQGRFPERN